MEEWPDDHLDELFRKSAEEYDVPFNTDDWTDMSRRLDRLDQQTLFDRVSRWGGIVALVLLLVGGFGWVMSGGKSTGGQQQAVISVITPGREAAGRRAGTDQSNKIDLTGQEGQRTESAGRNVPEQRITGVAPGVERQRQTTQSANDPAGQQTTRIPDKLLPDEAGTKARRSTAPSMAPVPDTRAASLGKRSAERREELPAPQPAALTRRLARQAAKKRSLPVGDEFVSERGSSTGDPLNRPTTSTQKPTGGTYPTLGGNVRGNRAGNQTGMVADLAERTPSANTEGGAAGPWLPAMTPTPSLSSVVQQVPPVVEPMRSEMTVSTPVQRPVPRLSPLSVLLFASPDLSTIGLKDFERPGSNAGLAVQYQLTDRLSVNTAFMYSTKRYQTYTDDYVLPSNQHLYVLPEEIIGVCKMIDIPLNVRYDWLLRPRGNGRAPARWFASAGLTSYFIQHEVYTYQYANPDDPKVKNQPGGWDNRAAGEPGGSFGFSTLNLSVGYERPITHRLSWQVEPFMKVPLKQVGYFQVKLLSTGAFVGLRYRL